LKDKVRVPLFPIATLEQDYFKLDGSYYLTPDDINPEYFLGWWTQLISNANGDFEIIPVLTADFISYHSSLGLGFFFDPLNMCYCTSFEVIWYRDGVEIARRLIEGNTEIECFVGESIENFNKLVIRFLKTDKPYRYVKLMEIDFGLSEIFDNDKLINASIIEEVDPIGGILSINKLRFTVHNENQKFNMIR
jgi:hypothetical protein